MKRIIALLLARFSEPSTYAGFASLAITAGVAEPSYAAVTTAAASVSGIAAMVLREAGKAE